MGYIPILLALLTFVLLLILVNINSIRARQQSLGLALFAVCQAAKSRNALLKRLRGVHPNLMCPTLPENYRLLTSMIPQISSFISAEWASLEESAFYLKNTPAQENTKRYLTSLHVLNHRQRINLRTFERKVREFNQLIESQPTAMVAALYGLKAIKLPSSRK